MSATPARGPKLPTGTIAWGDFDPTTDLAHTTWNEKTQWCRDTRIGSDARTGSAGVKLVLWALVDHADPYGVGWANHQTIADECEMGKRTVVRALAVLQEKGLIRRFARHDRLGYRASDVVILTCCLSANLAHGNDHLSANLTTPKCQLDQSKVPTRPHLSANLAQQENHPLEPPIEPPSEPKTETVETLFETSPLPAAKSAPPERFETFWNAYPKRKGKRAGKQQAIKAWNRMSATERDTAEQNLAYYLDYLERPDSDYALNAATYLNGRYTDWDEPADPTPVRTNGSVGRRLGRSERAPVADVLAQVRADLGITDGHTIDTTATPIETQQGAITDGR